MKRKTIIVAAVTTIVIVFVTFLLGLNNSKAEVHIFGITNQSLLYQNLQSISYVREKHDNRVNFTFIPSLPINNGSISISSEANESLQEDLISETLYIWYTFEKKPKAFRFMTKLRETYPGYSWSEILGLLPQSDVQEFEEKLPQLRYKYVSQTYPKFKREIDAFNTPTNQATSIITIDGQVVSQDQLITAYRIENLLVQKFIDKTSARSLNGVKAAYSSKDCNIKDTQYGIFNQRDISNPCTFVEAPEIAITQYTPSEDQSENILAAAFLEANFKNYTVNTVEQDRDTIKLVFPKEIENHPSFEAMQTQNIIRSYEDGYRFDIEIQR